MHYHLDTDVLDKKVRHCEKVYFQGRLCEGIESFACR